MEERPHNRRRKAEYSNNEAHGNSSQHNGDIYHFHGQAKEQHNQTQQAISQLSEDTGTRIDHISKVLSSSIDRDRAERFLGTLHFDRLALRREAVSDAAAETFDWILEAKTTENAFPPGFPAHTLAERMPLSTWLQEGCDKDLFWILGKPGSGKSTIMKFVHDDDRTQQLLSRWAGGSRRLVTAQHFFWHPGTTLQKSIEGLLRNLLRQVCGAVPALIEIIFPTRWDLVDTRSFSSKPWNVRELWDAIGRLRDLHDHMFFCFFIDGLDECHPSEQHRQLVERLLGLASGVNIKICVSSRPQPVLESSLDRTANQKLLLEELTYNDLREYSWKQISDAADSAGSCGNIRPTDIRALAETIASSAKGVFLWVRLVVDSIVERVIQGTDYCGLVRCLREFPVELEDYFRHMIFKRIHRTWHRSADVGKTFKLALCVQTYIGQLESRALCDWRNYHVVLETCQTDSMDELLSGPTTFFSSEELKMKEEALRRKLVAITGGLLTLTNGVVDFTHRTVFEFLGTTDMQILINESVPTWCNDPIWIARIVIARQKMRLEGKKSGRSFLSSIFGAFHLLEELSGIHCGMSPCYEPLEQVTIDIFTALCDQGYRSMTNLHDPERFEDMDMISRLFGKFLNVSCFKFASLVISQWPEVLGGNITVWRATFLWHRSTEARHLDLDFLRLLLSHGADPRVGEKYFALFTSTSSSPHRRDENERLLYQISYALLNDGASPPVTGSCLAGGDRMNAGDFTRLCDAIISTKHTRDKSKQDEIASRRTSIRARLWHPVMVQTSSRPRGPAHAVWVEHLQQECWVFGVDEHVHTIRGELEMIPSWSNSQAWDFKIISTDGEADRYRLLDAESDSYIRAGAQV